MIITIDTDLLVVLIVITLSYISVIACLSKSKAYSPHPNRFAELCVDFSPFFVFTLGIWITYFIPVHWHFHGLVLMFIVSLALFLIDSREGSFLGSLLSWTFFSTFSFSGIFFAK